MTTEIYSVSILRDTPPPPSAPGSAQRVMQFQIDKERGPSSGSLIGINHETGNLHVALPVASFEQLAAVLDRLQGEVAQARAAGQMSAPCFLHITSQMLNP